MSWNNNNNNPKHFTIPPPPNPYPPGHPPATHSMIMNPMMSYPYSQPPTSYLLSVDSSSSKRTLPTDTMGPQRKKYKPSDRLSAHELHAARLTTGTDTPIIPFQNPYKKEQRISVKEGDLTMWLDGCIIDIGYDWIQVHYDAFSKEYDTTIYVDPNHIEYNKYSLQLLSNDNIKSEFKMDNSNNNSDNSDDISDNEMDMCMGLNDKLLLKQLKQLVIAKREELNNKKYNTVIKDIGTFLNGFDITNIPANKYGIVSELYLIYAACLGQKAEFNQAIKYCKNAINISPKYYKSYTTLAVMYQFQQKYNEADKQYKIALKLDMLQHKKRQIQQSYNKLLIIMKDIKKSEGEDGISDIDSVISKSSEHKPIIERMDDSESDTASNSSGDEPIMAENNSENENKKRGKKGTTLDERLEDTNSMSSVQKTAYENRVKNPNGFYYRFNEEGEKQKGGGWSSTEHKSFMKRVLEFGVNIEWGFFSQVIEGRVGYQCSNYWRKLADDGYINDENYVMEKDKKGKMKRRQLKKKEIQENNNDTSDEYYERFRKYQFTVLKDPSGVFKHTPCKHPKAPNGGSGVVSRKKKGKKSRKKKHKKVKHKRTKHKKKRKVKRKKKRRLSDSESDSMGLSDMSVEMSEEESEYERRDKRKKKIKRERIKKEKGKKIKKEEPPNNFLCPISYELMSEPVMVKQSGWTYERSAIENWIRENGNDPNTRDGCCLDDLIPNRTLRDAINNWKQHVGYVKTEK